MALVEQIKQKDMMTEIDTDRARDVARALLGATPGAVVPFQPPVGGDDSHSFRLWGAGQPLLLKIKAEPGTPIGIYFYERIRAAGVPVPDLVAYAPQAGPRGEACAIWSWVEGRPAHWEAGEPCPYDEAEFGQLLRRIHDLRYDGPYGTLGDDPASRTFSSHPDLGPVSETWAGFFHCDRAARRYRDMGYLTADEARTLSDLPNRLAPVFAGPLSAGPRTEGVEPRLLHMGDIMHYGNMIVDGEGHIAAVVDYVESTAGDPRWELAWVDFYFCLYPYDRRAFDMARFRAGYGATHDPGDEVGRFYALAILIFEKLLFYRPETPRGAWAIGTVKELLRTFR
jgi:aminoglycoside phosphotransferase (APT) family kinase protein